MSAKYYFLKYIPTIYRLNLILPSIPRQQRFGIEPNIQSIPLQIIIQLFRHAHVFSGVGEEDFWFLVSRFHFLKLLSRTNRTHIEEWLPTRPITTTDAEKYNPRRPRLALHLVCCSNPILFTIKNRINI